MAATNYTPIQLYFSTTASAVPLAANLAQGELAINITDGKLYYEDNAGVVQVIATKGAGTIGGSTTQIQYNNAGALAGSAAMTFNSGTSTTTLTTLNLTNALGATYGGTAQSAYAQGDVLYASATNTLSKLGIGAVNYILTSTGSVPQWVAPSSVTVQTATNLAGGAAGSVPYQSGVATTTFLAIGAANTVMTSSGTAPQWVTSLTGLTGLSTSSFTNTSLTSGRVRYSTTGGLETDSASLTFNGTTLSAGGFSTTGLSTLVQTVKIGDSNFSGTAVFAAATPAKLYIGTGTVTDTTSAIGATNAVGAISSLAITPIAATNTSVTYTNAATLYIAGAPSAGTNVTLTNPYSLYVAAGAAYFGGTVTFASSIGALTVSSLTDTGLTSGRVTYAGTGGLLQDSANLTFNGTTLTANTLNLTNALGTAYGGTGLTSYTANGVLYASSSSALTTGSALTFDGTNLSLVNANAAYLSIQSLQSYINLRSTGAFNPFINFFSSTSTLEAQIQGVAGGGAMVFATGASATEQMRLTSTGLGIGTSTGTAKFYVQAADSAPSSSGNMTSGSVFTYAAGGVALNVGSSSSGYVYFNSAYANNAGVAAAYRFYQGATQAMTLTAAGQLLIGTTSSISGSNLTIGDASGVTTAVQYLNAGTGGAAIVGRISGANTWFVGDTVNAIGSGTGFINYVYGTNPWLVYTNGSERARIDSGGNLLVGKTDVTVTTNGVTIGAANYVASSRNNDIAGFFTRSGTDGSAVVFYKDTTAVGSISVTSVATLYNTTSDQRLKENIQDAAPASALIDSLQVRQYDWKSDGSHTRYGFVAQELVTVAPEAVHQPADPEEMMAVDYSKLVPMLVKEIQDLRKRLAAAGI